jgi:PAS domain S-box-containing protein
MPDRKEGKSRPVSPAEPLTTDASGQSDWPRPEGFFDQIVDAMADPLFVKDEQHRWIAMNSAFCELMGHPREELLGKSDFEFFSKEEAETFWAKDAEVFRTGGVNINEEPLTDADGKTHVIVTKKAVFTDSHGRRVLVGIIRDITDLRRAHEELQRARDELEIRVEERTREVEAAQAELLHAQKLEALGQLTGGIAHDFNNMLGVTLCSLEIAKEIGGDGPELQEVLDDAVASVDRAARLTDRLLAFSRRQTVKARPVDVGALLEDMASLLERTLAGRVNVELVPAPGATICKIDPGQLESAILNLAINAQHAMPEGGQLRITTAPKSLDEAAAARVGVPAGDYVAIEVSDTGSGMPDEVIEQAFEPFFTTKGAGEGSGLGLSMIHGFVKQAGGHVSIESSPGRGTTVELLLPAHEGPSESVESEKG